MLLRMARTFDQADNILVKTWCKTDSDKVEYLRQLFSEELSSVEGTGDPKKDYRDFVAAIIHSEENESYMWGYKDGAKSGQKEGYADCVRHIVQDWNTLRLLSQEGIREHFKRILHEDIFAED